MNKKILFLPALTALLLTVATGAVADGPVSPPVKPLPAITGFKAPADLGLKRQEAFNKSLARAGLPALTIPPPPAHVRLTPAAPTGAGGARIASVGRSTYVGPSNDTPDGAFMMEPAYTGPTLPLPGILFQPPNPTGRVELVFTTEASKSYMVDCSMSGITTQLGVAPLRNVWFGRPTIVQTFSMDSQDGHYLYAFRADAMGPTTVDITFKQDWGYFYGCDITKVN